MVLGASKCGKTTIHLQAKDTGKHFVKSMTCNKLECPNCQPVISARIKKRIRYAAQHERLVFFNTITSTEGFNDLESVFKKIRKELSFNFTIQGYMKRKNVNYEKAFKWYEKKKQKYIEADLLVELERISRMEAIIEVAKQKKIFYQRLTEEQKKIFKLNNYTQIQNIYKVYLNNNLKNKTLKEKLYDKILQRFNENEDEEFKFIRVIEFHKSGQPHYHFLTNKYIPHSLFKKITTDGVNDVYDNSYIVEDALKKNPRLDPEDVNTDIVANYVSKITDYITKDTIETYSDLKKNNGFNKKLISSSDCIKIFDDGSDDDLKYKKIGVYDYVLNATNYEIPESALNNVEEFIKINSDLVADDCSVQLMNELSTLNLNNVEKHNFVISKRLEQIGTYNSHAIKNLTGLIANLSEEQKFAIELFNKSRISLLIGRAGTGKSYTITNLLKFLNLNPASTLIVTYTGKAASRLRELFHVNGLSSYKPKTIHKACSSSFSSKFLKNEKNVLQCDYLIIDEVSMIPKEILAKLLLAVPTHVKVLFAGDDAQLPPVNDVSIIPELKVNPYVKTAELTKVFRSDDKVLSYAHKVLNKENIDFQCFAEDLKDIVHNLVDKGYQILTNTKKMTKEINMIVQEHKTEITRCFNDFKYNIGDRVMIVANSSPREVSNGDTGIIQTFNDKGVIIQLDHEDRQVFYKYEDTEEIVPAYAFTVHKSQGSEYEKVAVILEDQPQLNTNNLLYTAITRAKKDVKIFAPNEFTLKSSISNTPVSDNIVTINSIVQKVMKIS